MTDVSNVIVQLPAKQGELLEVIDPADVAEADIEWLIEHLVQAHTLNLIQGHGGTNKGTYCCLVGAKASRGELSNGEPMMVLYSCAEDDHATVLKPRLLAAGANMEFVRFVPTPSFPRDIHNGKLQRTIHHYKAGLLFIDPLVTFLGRIDAHKDQEVKHGLTPIIDVAQKERCTIVGVHHFTKSTERGALLSGNGSGAFGNTARIVLAMVKDPEDDNLRILEVVKSNGGITGINRLFRLQLTPVTGLKRPQVTLTEEGESAKSADEALATPRRNSKSAKARDLILAALNGNPIESDELDARIAREANLAARTVKNLRMELGHEGLVRSIPDTDEHGTIIRWLVTRTNASTP
jgi:putative DNA primase/helicase